MVWIEDQGEGPPLSYTSYFRTSFSFSLWLGEWDHFTRRTETFQMISNMYSYFFVHTLHCMGFQWILGDGGMMRPSVQGVDHPVCCVLDAAVTYARDSSCWFQEGLLSSRGGGGGGGGRHTGTRLTLPISSNFAQPLKRNGPTFHRPQSTTWSTLCEGDVLHCVRQMVVTPSSIWICHTCDVDGLSCKEVLTNTDLDRFVDNIWEK